MTIPFPSGIRLTGWLLAGSFVAAVAIGKMSTPAPTLRSIENIRHASFPSIVPTGNAEKVSFVDLKSGEAVQFQLPTGEVLDWPSCSPWRDENGQSQVAGRWFRRSGHGASGLTSEYGLARYTFPAGAPLNRVVTEIAPKGEPCWYPGTSARILFAAGDGSLYQFAFEGSRSIDASPDGCDARPRPIVWKTTPPGEDERSVRLTDPVWPVDRAFGGRLIVSLSTEVQKGDRRRWTPPQFWWLQLDSSGSAIEAAGPLAEPLGGSDPDLRRRYARPIRRGDGRFQLAFLSHRAKRVGWDLRVAPLTFDSAGLPRIEEIDDAPIVDEECAAVAPAFSTDGRWIYYLSTRVGGGEVRRSPTPTRSPADRVADATARR